MMKTKIFKYILDLKKISYDNFLEIDMPIDAKILAVGNQNDNLCVWAQVDDNIKQNEKRVFFIVGTGHVFPHELSKNFIGTVLLFNGDLVLHVFGGL